MAVIGYARTSTVEQEAGLDAQQRDLTAAGADKLFSEQVSSVSKREKLEHALEYLREGDVLMVTKIDRLARSMRDLSEIVDRITDAGATLRILEAGIDTGSAYGELILNMLGSFAQFERSIMLERQREGIAKAKAEGKYKGRKPTAMAKAPEVLRLLSEGVSERETARRVGIARSSVQRIKLEHLRR